MYSILIIDNDPIFLKTTKRLLETSGFIVGTIGNPTQVKNVLSKKYFHCILLDLNMPAMNGIEVLKFLREKNYTIPVIMISGEGTIHLAVESLKLGAYDFLEKPLDPDRLLNTIHNAVERRLLIEENELLFKELKKNLQIVGTSSSFKNVYQAIETAAKVDSKVLITGESGTGKSLIARAIHFQSNRRSKPLIEVNCAAVPTELLESELFGYKKGAFTGARDDKEGIFVAADGGTIFLDEIGDMELRMQSKILKVLDNEEVRPLGSAITHKIDVRVIAATNKKIEYLLNEKKFRSDLYYRLKVIHIHIPPLRERKEDILPLAYHFLEKFSRKLNKPVTRIHPFLESTLTNYTWPGNVRELENVMERMIVFAKGNELNMDDYMHLEKDHDPFLTQMLQLSPSKILPFKQAMDAFQKNYLGYALNMYQGNISKTAEALRLDRSNLYKKLRKFGLDSGEK